MIVEVSAASKATKGRKPVLVIDWDAVSQPCWREMGPEIAASLHELARRGAGWSAVKTEAEPEGGR
jgi:hypothetical protein